MTRACRQRGGRRNRPGLAVALALLLAAGCDLPGKPDPAKRWKPPGQVDDFGTLYGMHCAGCHGADGRLGPAPPLNDALFLAVAPGEALRQVISHGREGTLMPAFGQEAGGPLTPKQVGILVETMQANWGKPAGDRKEPLPPYAVDLKAGNREAGARLFDQACATCHGDEGKGSQQAGPLHNAAFLALVSDQFLRRIIITGRPDLGMPDYRSAEWRSPQLRVPLSSQDINDLVAYLAAWRPPAPEKPGPDTTLPGKDPKVPATGTTPPGR